MSAGYRLVKKKRVNQAFDGEGARLYGGRWNSKGKSCIYLASTASLALLEVMVHLDDYDLLSSYILFQIELPDSSLLKFDLSSLPKDWKDDPAPFSTAQIGDDWITDQPSLGLCVPSTIMPIESNILLNPNHPDFEKSLESVEEVIFNPDPRL